MAFGKGKESTGTAGGSFVKHIGIGMFEIAAINPNAKEYEELFGRAPQNDINYVSERDGHLVARVCVYLRNITGGATSNFITQVNFFLALISLQIIAIKPIFSYITDIQYFNMNNH